MQGSGWNLDKFEAGSCCVYHLSLDDTIFGYLAATAAKYMPDN
jgi:hypothetical protein